MYLTAHGAAFVLRLQHQNPDVSFLCYNHCNICNTNTSQNTQTLTLTLALALTLILTQALDLDLTLT